MSVPSMIKILSQGQNRIIRLLKDGDWWCLEKIVIDDGKARRGEIRFSEEEGKLLVQIVMNNNTP